MYVNINVDYILLFSFIFNKYVVSLHSFMISYFLCLILKHFRQNNNNMVSNIPIIIVILKCGVVIEFSFFGSGFCVISCFSLSIKSIVLIPFCRS